jgi:hypothetical protein
MNFSLLVINRIKFLAIYQIAGGIIGFLLVGWFFLQFGSISGIYLFAPLIAFFLFGYSIYCGVILLQKKESGIRLSLISQWLQLFGFIFFGYGFKFASGVFISIGIDLSREVEFALNFNGYK